MAVPQVDAEIAGVTGKKALQDDPHGKCFTYNTFPNTIQGRSSIRDYLMVMRRRFEDLKGVPLVDDHGVIAVGGEGVHGEAWNDLLTKGPLYLLNLQKEKPDVSTGVFLALRAAVPTVTNGTKRFLKLLHDISLYGPELLPGMPK